MSRTKRVCGVKAASPGVRTSCSQRGNPLSWAAVTCWHHHFLLTDQRYNNTIHRRLGLGNQDSGGNPSINTEYPVWATSAPDHRLNRSTLGWCHTSSLACRRLPIRIPPAQGRITITIAQHPPVAGLEVWLFLGHHSRRVSPLRLQRWGQTSYSNLEAVASGRIFLLWIRHDDLRSLFSACSHIFENVNGPYIRVQKSVVSSIFFCEIQLGERCRVVPFIILRPDVSDKIQIVQEFVSMSSGQKGHWSFDY
jgi:hypothetical protein